MNKQEKEALEREQIRQIIQDREIKHLFHFTPVDNLDSILKKGLKSRAAITQNPDEYPNVICPDEKRIDGRKNGICLSVSFPNHYLLQAYREREEYDWAIIVLDINLILEAQDREVLFFQTNAASSRFIGVDRCFLKSPDAFQSLFAYEVQLNNTLSLLRGIHLPKKYPTNVQAEVMVTDYIEHDYIKGVIFNNNDLIKTYYENWSEHYKFYYGEGFFSNREDYLKLYGWTSHLYSAG